MSSLSESTGDNGGLPYEEDEEDDDEDEDNEDDEEVNSLNMDGFNFLCDVPVLCCSACDASKLSTNAIFERLFLVMGTLKGGKGRGRGMFVRTGTDERIGTASSPLEESTTSSLFIK